MATQEELLELMGKDWKKDDKTVEQYLQAVSSGDMGEGVFICSQLVDELVDCTAEVPEGDKQASKVQMKTMLMQALTAEKKSIPEAMRAIAATLKGGASTDDVAKMNEAKEVAAALSSLKESVAATGATFDEARLEKECTTKDLDVKLKLGNDILDEMVKAASERIRKVLVADLSRGGGLVAAVKKASQSLAAPPAGTPRSLPTPRSQPKQA